MPPQSRGDGGEFELEWGEINAGVSGLPVEYPLTLKGDQEGRKDSIYDDEEEDVPLLPMICHRVKVQR